MSWAQAPANDLFANRATLTGTSVTVNVSNVNATAEFSEPAHAGNVAAKSIWWQWTAPQSGRVSVDTFGSAIDTVLAVYRGPALPSLVNLAFNDEAGGVRSSALVFYAAAGVTYTIAVDGYQGASGNIRLRLVSTDSTDLYTTDFESFTVGSDTIIGTDGWSSTNYGSGASGIIQSTQFGSKAAYVGFNSTTDSLVSVWRPIGYLPVAAATPTVNFSVDLAIIDSTNGKRDAFFFLLYNASGQLLASLAFDNVGQRIYRYDGSVYRDVGAFTRGTRYALTASINFAAGTWTAALAGTTLFANQQVNAVGRSLSLGMITTTWLPTTTGSPGDNYLLFDNYRIGLVSAAAAISSQPTNQAVFAGETATFSVVATGVPAPSYQWQISTNSGGSWADVPATASYQGQQSSILSVMDVTLAASGNQFRCVVSNVIGAPVTSTAATLTVSMPTPPSITTQPSYTSNTIGVASTISVVAAGQGLRYQWYRNGVPITAAGSALSITSLSVTDLGDYYVVVSNGAGAVTSQPVSLGYNLYQTPPDSFWLDAKESGGVVYFLFASPARILRYDLAGETWLPAVSLTSAATSIAVAEEAIYLAAGTRIARYDRNIANETTFATTSQTVTGLIVAGDFLVAATNSASVLSSYRRSTGQKVNDTSVLYSGGGFSYSAEAGRIYWRSFSVSPSDILGVPIDANGMLGFGSDSPYHGAYPDGRRTMVLNNGAFVADDSGTVYRTTDLVYAGSFGGRADDLAPLANGEGHLLRGSKVQAYDTEFRTTADFQLSGYAFRMWRNASGLLVFSQPVAAGGTPSVEKVLPAQLRTPQPATPLEAMGRKVTPTRMVLDENGVLYVSSAALRNVFRWSTTSRKYLPPIPLLGAANYLAYSAENRALYTDDGANVVRRVTLDSMSLLEAAFIGAPRTLTGLQTAGRTVFFTDPSGAWHTHYTATAEGNLVSAVDWNRRSREFTWSAATNRMFFFRDDTSPNDLHFETIDGSGKIAGGGETPYHSSDGIVPPIRVAPDGSAVLLGSGRVYDGSNLTQIANLGITLLDAAWQEGAIHTIQNLSGATQVSSYSGTTYQYLRGANFSGVPLRLFALGADRLLLVTDVGGYLNYRVITSTTLAVVSEDNTSGAAAPAAPQLIAHPWPRETIPGGTVTLSVVVFSQTPVSYQWRRGGSPLSDGTGVTGATTSSLTLTNVQAADLGSFDLVATNAQGSATSAAAAVSFAVAPSITTTSSTLPVAQGATISLTVATTGSAPMTYQWRRNGAILLDSAAVTGANRAKLTLPNIQSAAAGTYSVTVSNQAGSATATLAIINVFVPTPPTITTQPQSASVDAGQSVTFSVAVSGTSPFTYEWRKNSTAIPGATNATLTLANVQGADAGIYSVSVTNAAGWLNSANATLTVRTPPVVTVSPANVDIQAGSSAQFSVTATGGSLTYQWQQLSSGASAWVGLRDEGVFSGATTSTLTLTGVAYVLNGAQFRCVVTNQLGVATSGAATMTVRRPSPVVAVYASGAQSKILKADGTLWGMGFNANGTVGDGTVSNQKLVPTIVSGDVASAGIGSEHGFLIKNDGSMWGMGANNQGQLGDGTTIDRSTPVQIASGVMGAGGGLAHTLFVKTDGTLWAMGSNAYGQLGDGTQSGRLNPVQVMTGVASVAIGLRFSLFLKTDGTLWGMGMEDSGQLGDGQLTTVLRTSPVHSANGVVKVAAGHFQAFYISTDGALWGMGNNQSGQLGDGTFTNRSTPVSIAPAAIAVASGGLHSVFIKPDRTLWAMGANDFGQLGDGTNQNRNSPVQIANTVVSVAAGYRFTLFSKADGSLWGMGANDFGQLGDGTTTQRNSPVQILAPPPAVITVQPLGRSVIAGQSVTFSVTAVGGGTLTYQWRKGGVALAGATGASLTINGTQTSDAGSYDVVVANGAGTETSVVAVLTVTAPAMITLAPKSQSAPLGTPVTLSVTAGGTAPISYQWRKDGAAIPGATGTTLALAAVQTTDAGSYDVIATNAGGSVTSAPAVLTVVLSPVIATAPQTQSAAAGADVTLSVSVVGLSPFTYQWSKDGVAIAGATNATLTLSALTTAATGRYTVVVTNTSGTTTSDVAFVLVQSGATQATGSHSLPSDVGYRAGGTIRIVSGVTFSGTLSRLDWQVLLPAGWSFVEGAAAGAATQPAGGDASLLEWTWANQTASPVTFSYTLRAPASARAAFPLAALLTAEQSGNVRAALAQPDPLWLFPLHSGDTMGATPGTPPDGKFNLAELLRVIELYNYRAGTVRTGQYSILSGTEDGYTPGPNGTALTTIFHSADTMGTAPGTPPDGKLNLAELLRVIELYNVRSGTVRTGQYRVLPGTDDGFAPGP
ncbi:MAG: immunoglobulin domain-containing protein [Verrucomicrobia bacterium]|nr:immunoglobulin domain-containing protein [Verrucomicrobiota bacterium]